VSPAAAPAAAAVRLVAAGSNVLTGGLASVRVVRTRFNGDRLPVRDEVRIGAVDFEPRQRLGKIVSVGERFLGARRRLNVA